MQEEIKEFVKCINELNKIIQAHKKIIKVNYETYNEFTKLIKLISVLSYEKIYTCEYYNNETILCYIKNTIKEIELILENHYIVFDQVQEKIVLKECYTHKIIN